VSKPRSDRLLPGFLIAGVSFYVLTTLLNGETPDEPANTVATAEATVAPARGSLGSYDLRPRKAVQIKLPKRLREISGLAVTDDGRLLAHNDEAGIVFELDDDGDVVKAFFLSDLKRPVADDFEGIAVGADRIYLVSSAGRIYEFAEGGDGEAVLYTMYTTGVGRDCEIESLAFDPEARALVMMCKNPLSPKQQGKLTLFRWSIDTKRLVDGARISIPISDFAQHIKGRRFQPSAIERHPETGHFFVVAAQQAVVAEITPDGRVVGMGKLSADLHRQAEGIAFLADGSLLIADEGAGKRARLTRYPPTRD